jgi:hypothetical protein
MKKRKNLVIAGLEPEYFHAFDSVAEGLDLTRSEFLIALMVQNGVIPGGLEHVMVVSNLFRTFSIGVAPVIDHATE